MILALGDTPLFARVTVSIMGGIVLGEMEPTSQWPRMTERPPATDLRGGNTSEDSFTRLMANLVVAYVVDFQSDFFIDTAFESAV